MNRMLHFYNYEQCYAHYTKRIMSIRQAKIHGEVVVEHKLTDDSWFGKIAAEGLGAIAALLLAA